MNKLQRAAVAAALAAALAAAGLGVVGATANATTAAPAHRTQAVAPSWRGAGSVRANEQVVEAFLQDVVNEHNSGAAASFLTPDMQWSGGTVGTITGSANVAGLFAGVVAAFPDAHVTINDIFGQGDQVVVRVVVSGSASPPAGATSSGTASTSTASATARSATSGPATTGPRSSTTPARTRHPGSPDPPSAQARCYACTPSKLVQALCNGLQFVSCRYWPEVAIMC